jgi:hypothetical protein
MDMYLYDSPAVSEQTFRIFAFCADFLKAHVSSLGKSVGHQFLKCTEM